jgi:4-amino-4-deoxy-L-arabinose transferase-like glycosyltransferase
MSVSDGSRSIEHLRDARRPYSLYAFVGILLLAMVWGVFVRFDGLGSRPLAVDEYFTVTSVQYVVEKGVPEFPTGGYYVRGLPLQYLQAASVLLFGDNEFAHRLPAALFGVVTLVVVFFYARIFLPWPLAAACVAMLAVSSWEIEFSRFSRMYAAFQCITVAFFLAYHRAYFSGREKLKYLPHALALMAVIFHELGVFLLPFLFLPLFIHRGAAHGATPPRNRWTFVMVSLATTLIGIAYSQFDSRLRDFHVGQTLPDSFHVPPSDALGPLQAYTVLPITGKVVAILLIILLAAGFFMFFRFRSAAKPPSRLTVVDLLLLLLLLSTILHLFVVSICIAAVLFIRYQLHRTLLRDRGRLALLLLSGLTAFAWVFYAWYDQSWREQMLTGELLRAFRIVFFGWPDFYDPIVAVWKVLIPIFTVIFLSALVWHFIQQGRKSVTAIVGHPIIIILGVFSSVAVVDPFLKPRAKSTRYFYHVYPFVILLIVMACYEIVRRVGGRITGPKTPVLLSGLVVTGLFFASEDFNPQQLLHINSPEVTFRTGKFKRYEQHWYWRRDDRSLGEFLNAHRNEVDALVVSWFSRALPYYLHRGVDFAYYCPREGTRENAWRYRDSARSKGTLDLWTGHPLLGTEEELRAYTEHIQSLYLVRLVAPGTHEFDVDIGRIWPGRLITSERVFLNSDGSIEIVKIALKQPDQKTRPVSLEGKPGTALPANH